MLNNWLDKDNTINLLELFKHFGYDTVVEEKTHTIFKKNNRYRVVFLSENGFLYYHTDNPQKKYAASNLIIEEVSRIEGHIKESLWDRTDNYYNNILRSKEFKLDGSKYKSMVRVPLNFNHFLSYNIPLKTIQSDLYHNLTETNSFEGRIFENRSGEPLFPLYNIQNEVSGYFVDGKDGIKKFKESDTKNSLWYSNIPESIEWLVVFKDPKEAVAFHKKFRLNNAVYIALGEINYETTKILFQIHQLTKVKKIVLSFTGSKKIKGYLRDLNFISFMDDSNFILKLGDGGIGVKFRMGGEKSFLRFYNSIKKFNQGLANDFLKYNNVIDQYRINKHSIIIGKENETINIRIPLEVNAIKYFVWSYYKNYLNKSMDILKPKQNNWFLEWEADQSITLMGKEEQLEEYKIAL